jgi:hypothetical protein
MLFLRYQEYYESPKFRGKLFKIIDYIEWYSKHVGGNTFSYPDDYDGFNLPGWVLKKVVGALFTEKYDEVNKYDLTMIEIMDQISAMGCYEDFNLIGVSKETGGRSTINHEIAHGLYSTDALYKAIVNKMIRELPNKIRQCIFNALQNAQYHRSVWVDEANAFLATGFHPTWKINGAHKYRLQFSRVFDTFYNKNKVE